MAVDSLNAMDDGFDIGTMMNRLSWLLVGLLLLAAPLFQGHWITPNVYTVRVARCSVDWDVERGIVAVACQGRDLIRVWALSVEWPWWEDEVQS
jgi:hypothetical protein